MKKIMKHIEKYNYLYITSLLGLIIITTVYILQAGIAQANGFTWDKVRIRVNGKEGYMINQNYK